MILYLYLMKIMCFDVYISIEIKLFETLKASVAQPLGRRSSETKENTVFYWLPRGIRFGSNFETPFSSSAYTDAYLYFNN